MMTPAPSAGRLSLRRRLVTAPLFAFALLPLVAGAAHAGAALPTGGKVVAGQASIGAPSAGGGLTISQSSGKAIIDWTGFSIGKGGEVSFQNGSGATLNRVTGTGVSSLDGLLTATGSVYLINPNGVIIGKDGVVKVGGTFVASTLDLSDNDFLNGGSLSFTGPSTAAVINLGKVGSLGGDVALIAATVSNAGSIAARNGDAGLLSGSRVLIADRSLDEGRFAVELGSTGGGVTNAGLIAAADAELRAENGNVYALAGDTAGVIRATGVKSGGGKVWLVAQGGTLDVAGSITAQGAKGNAGAIETSGGAVTIGKASLDAHGGTWLVDPYDLTIDSTAATTIDNTLNAGTSVAEQTTATGSSGAGTVNTSGSGDIILAAPLSWTTNANLTLSAYRNVTLNAGETITSTGGGAVTLYADNTGTGTGTVSFGSGAGVSTSGAVNIFYNPAGNTNSTVNGSSYTSPTDFSSYVSGGGALSAYMLVNTVFDLQNIQNSLGGKYALGANINAAPTAGWNSGAGFTPIGSGGSGFAGTLNGQGETISGLTINRSGTNSVGLFSVVVSPAVIENVGLVGGSVTGGNSTGGLVGAFNAGTVVSDYASTNVTGSNYVGGLIGYAGGTVTSSSASGTVTGVQNVGGFAGYSASLSFDSASGAVTGNTNVGGLVGITYSGGVANSYATGAVTGNVVSGTIAQYIGGLEGSAGGTVSQSYATGTVSTPGDRSNIVGGLVGQAGGAITQSYATGAVVGSNNGQDFGGLVGVAFGPVTQDYATGAVSGGFGASSLGGLVGQMAGGAISQSWSSGAVTNTRSSSGGLVGYFGGGSISSSYWDTSTSGHTSSAGGGTGLTTAQFFNATSPISGLGLGTSAGASGFVIIDSDGTLNGSNGATRPILLSEYATTIANAHQLELANLNLAGNYTVGANIDASATNGTTNPSGVWGTAGFVPIGPASTAFSGAFDGQGHTIAGLYINQSSSSGAVGLFGSATGALANVGLTGVSITGGAGGGTNVVTGGLAGSNAGSVSNSYVTGTVIGGSYTGGLIGYQAGGAISQSYSTAQVSGEANGYGTGGLVGLVDGSTYASSITGSYATGAVTGYQHVGGLVGLADAVTISQSDATGRVNAVANFAGGLVGEMVSGSVTGSYATGAAGSSGGSYVGGLVGYDYGGTSNQNYATGAVSGGNDLGGLVGYAYGGSIQQSYATGSVTGPSSSSNDTGGLVGYNADPISQSYALGAVTVASQSDSVGGLVGFTSQPISQSYATGGILAPLATNVGGLAGASASSGLVTSSYWDQQTTGQATSAGGGTAVTTAQFQTASNLPGLTFGTTGGGAGFVIVDGDGTLNNAGGAAGSTRPLLLSEYSTSIVNAHQLQLMELNLSTNYTLAANIDASATTGAIAAGLWTTAGFVPIATNSMSALRYAGVFNGQGFTINGLTIYRPSASYIGLFGYVTGLTTTLENVGLVGGSFTGVSEVAPLVGMTAGGASIVNDYSSASVAGTIAYAGGLVARAGGTITGSYATGSVTGVADVGGLSGANVVVSQSYATGAVSGQTYVGGLSGYSNGTVSQSYATGAVTGMGSSATTGSLGGLLGYNTSALTGDHATGAVTGGANDIDIGGLVGDEQGGTIYQSYARGAVSADVNTVNVGGLVGVSAYSTTATTTQDYATGVVTAGSGSSNIGGLEGQDRVSTSQSYATGAVNAPGATNVGGLVGMLTQGTVGQSYATGLVTGGSAVDGLIGLATSGSQATNSYYDADTTGQALGTQADGSQGVHTTALQSSLPSGFSSTAWSIVAGESYPYLNYQFSSAPQVVSGLALVAAGGRGLSGATVNAYYSGAALVSTLTGGAVTTGADGYYYYLLAPGTLTTSSSDHIGAVARQGATPLGISYTDSTAADGSALGLNVTSGLTSATTSDTSYSALQSHESATFGTGYSALQTALVGDGFALAASGAFTFDQAVSFLGAATVTAGGPLSLNQNLAFIATNISLTTTSGAITLAGPLETRNPAGTITLNGAGGITENTGGAVYGTTLIGSAGGDVTMNQANLINALGAFTVTNGSFTLSNGYNAGLNVNGAVQASNNLTLVTTQGNLNLNASVSTGSTGTATLRAAGALTQSGGAITTATLTGSSGGATTLTASGNVIAALGAFTVTNGTFGLNDGAGLIIDGPVTVTTGGFAPTLGGGLTLAGNVTTGGAQTYAAATTLGVDATLTTGSGQTVTFGSTLDGAHALSILGGAVFEAQVGATTPLTALTVSGALNLAGGAVTTTGTQTYQGAATLGEDTTLTGSQIAFSSTLDGAHALTIAGDATVQGGVGSTAPLTSFTVTGQTGLGGNVTTTGAQTYEGALILSGPATLTASSATFDSTLNGAYALTISGPATFQGAVGGQTELASLAVQGAVALDGGAVTTTGAQTYSGAVTLGSDTSLSGGGTIRFGSTLDGAQALTISGPSEFDGAVGATTQLTALTTSGGAVALDGGAVSTTGAQSYGGAATLGSDATLQAASVTFGSTLDGAYGLAVQNASTVAFDGAVGLVASLASLSTSGATTLGGSVTTTGQQTYNGSVTLGAPDTLTGSLVKFASTVDGAYDLTTKGGAEFDAAVGGVTPLASLTTSSGPVALDGAAITTTGAQSFGGAATLGVDTTLQGSRVAFNASLDGAYGLTVQNASRVAFGTVGGQTALTSLTVSGGATTLGGSVTTMGDQTYTGAATLVASDTLTGSLVKFASTVDGGFGLSTSGGAEFDGLIGSVTPLASLTVDGPSVSFTNGTGAADNDVASLSVTLTSALAQGFSFRNAGALSVAGTDTSAGNGAVTIGTDSGALTLAGAVNTGTGALTLNSAATIAQTGGAITAGELTGSSVGGASFGQAGNTVTTLAAFSNTGVGVLSYRSDAPLTIGGAVSSTGGGSVVIATPGGDLTIGASGSVSADGTGQAVVLASGGSFINQGGGSALSTPNGTWLVYSQSAGGAQPTGNSAGGLTALSWYGDFYSFGSSGVGSLASATGAGDRFVYGYQPTLTVDPNSGSVVYDGQTHTDTYTVAGLQNGDQAGYAAQGVLTTSGKDVMTYSFSSGITSGENYAIAYGPGQFSITPRQISVKGHTLSTTYGDGAPGSVASVIVGGAGLGAGDTVGGASVGSATATSTSDVGTYSYTLSNLQFGSAQEAADYAVTYSASPLIVTPKLLDVSLTGTVEKSYNGGTGAALAAGNYDLSGILNGDDVSLANAVSGTYQSSQVQSGGEVVATGLSLSGAKAADYTVRSSVSGDVGVITPATLTASLLGTVQKVYDGTTLATLAAGDYGLAGVLGSDSVMLNDPTIGAYDTKDVATGKTVSVSGLKLSGGQARDYVLQSASISGAVGTVTPETITATLAGKVAKTYDGTTAATLSAANYKLNGVHSGDSVGLNDPTAGTYDTKDAGTGKTVSASGLQLTGAAAGDYSIISTVSGAVGVITPKLLTAGLTGQVKKTYNGTTAATLASGNYTLQGVVSGDSVALNDPTSGTYRSSQVQSSGEVIVTGLALNGTDAGDYSVRTSVSGDVVVITPATLTASLSGTVQKVYDGTTLATLVAGNYGLSGSVTGDDVELEPATHGLYATPDVGTDKLVTVAGLKLEGTQARDYVLKSATISADIGTITPKQ